MSGQREQYIAGLRILADALESHEEIPLPYQGSSSELTFHFLFGADPRAEMAAAARALPCSWRKELADGEHASYLELHGELAGLKVYLTAYRDAVCTRRVTGTEKRTVKKVVTPAVEEEVEEEVETYEWDCGSIFRPASPVSAGAVTPDTEVAA